MKYPRGTIHDSFLQGTPEWHDIKRGRIGASSIADVLMNPDKAGYRNLRAKLVCERLTGQTEESYCSADMQRGMDLEPYARLAYEFETGSTVRQVAWVDHPTIKDCGCSPDGLIGEVGGIEIKCLNNANHLDTILAETIDGRYMLQMQEQMACCGLEWIDFVSYNPNFGTEHQLKIIRVTRDNEKIAEIEKAVKDFLADVEKMYQELISK